MGLLKKLFNIPDLDELSESTARPTVEKFDVFTMTDADIDADLFAPDLDPEELERNTINMIPIKFENCRTVEENLDTMFNVLDDDEQTELIEVIEQVDSKADGSIGLESPLDGDNESMEIVIDDHQNIKFECRSPIQEEELEENDPSMIEYAVSEDGEEIAPSGIAHATDNKNGARKRKRLAKHRCELCTANVSPDELETHMNQHEEMLPIMITSAKFFRCGRCRSVYPSVQSFGEHFLDPERCNEIAERTPDGNYTDYQFLEDKITSAIENISLISCRWTPENDYTCDVCECSADSYKAITDHFQNEHLGDHENFADLNGDTFQLEHTCGICMRQFSNLKDIAFHVYFHQEHFYCPVTACDKMLYSSYSNLRRHLDRQHVKESHPCPYCQTVFQEYRQLRTHLRIECTARTMNCRYCGMCAVFS